MSNITDKIADNALLWLCLHYSPKQMITPSKDLISKSVVLKSKETQILYLGNTLVGTFNQNNISEIESLTKEVKANLDYQFLCDNKTFIMRVSDQKELRTIQRWFISKSKKLTR